MKRSLSLFCFLISFITISGQVFDTITDSRDGQKYRIVLIGDQWWMAENINAGARIDGSQESANNSIIEKYCYNDDTNNCKIYGGLYQWDEMMQYYPSDSGTIGTTQGVCPSGWHLPTDNEVKGLEMSLGMSQAEADAQGSRGTDEAGKLKATGTTYWQSPNTGATNLSGFTALPGGTREKNGVSTYFGTDAFFWSSTEKENLILWRRILSYNEQRVFRDGCGKDYALSVRCVMDVPDTLEITLTAKNTTNLGASDGSIDLTVSGGLPPYSFNWSNTEITEDITGLSAGVFTVSVTDALDSAAVDSIRIYDTFIDGRDSNVYKAVTIGEQVWMAENLRATKYSDSTIIPHIKDLSAWDALLIPDKAYCYYDNDISNSDTNGVLYTWPTAMNGAGPSDANPSGIQGVCPTDWHLPSDAEWKELEMHLGMSSAEVEGLSWRGTDEGGRLKDIGTTLWNSPNTDANDSTGFSGIPSGYRGVNGYFYHIGNYAYFWSTEQDDWDIAWHRRLYYDNSQIGRDGSYKNAGYSVRCLRSPIECAIETIQLSENHISCYGNDDGKINLSVTGTGPFEYDWSNGETTQNISDLSAGWYSILVTDSVECQLTDSIEILEPEILQSTISDSAYVSTPGASDGSATITPSGGTLPYSYLWDDNLSTTDSTAADLLANKWYHVTVTDANLCFSMDSVMLFEPGILSAEITDSSNVSCNGMNDGSATVTGQGGAPPYSILWNDDAKSTIPTVTNLSPGRWYTVTLTDAAMQTMKDSVYIIEPESIDVLKTFSKVSCPGVSDGFIDLTVSGGSLPYSYKWSNTETTEYLSDLFPGEYSVMIKDSNGCMEYDTTVIDSVTSYQGQEICMVTVSLDNKNLIVWERPAISTIEKFNIYRYTVEFDYLKIGTVNYDSLSIFLDESSEPREISHFYKISVVDKCGNESALSDHHKTMHLTANVGTADEVNLIWENYQGFPFVQYSLYRGSTTDQMEKIRSLANNVNSFTDFNHPVGFLYYQTRVERPTPCYPSSSKKSGTGPYYHSLSNMDDNKLRIGFEQLLSSEGLLIFPNPVSDRVTIKFANPNHEEYQLVLTDLTGKVLKIMEKITENQVELDPNGLLKGMYLIKLRGSKNFEGKLVVE